MKFAISPPYKAGQLESQIPFENALSLKILTWRVKFLLKMHFPGKSLLGGLNSFWKYTFLENPYLEAQIPFENTVSLKILTRRVKFLLKMYLP